MRIALDWTPNANHVGFYVARAKGFIPPDTQLLSPEADGYALSPAKAVLAGAADLAVAPTETAIAYASPATAAGPRPAPALLAVAALLQRDTSAIAVLASNAAIQRPRDLDGKRYASYNARYEGALVRALVQADGGKGEVAEAFPPRLDCFERVLAGSADATWIFLPHEGCLAAARGTPLRTFSMAAAGIPYGYSPLLLAAPALLAGPRAGELRALLAGVARGYAFAAAHPAEAAECLRSGSGPHPSLADAAFVRASVEAAAPAFLSAQGAWGAMEGARWEEFLSFLAGRGMLTGREGGALPAELAPRAGELFTNAFLPEAAAAAAAAAEGKA
jgi:ABC-type nitrate/sulfonate/bicarbonate transport system substrate-binding protein